MDPGRAAGAAYHLDVLRKDVILIKNKDDLCKRKQATVDVEVTFQKRNAEILQWISSSDPMLTHESVLARTKINVKYTDSGEWLLERPEFKHWNSESSEDQVLWLYGTGI